MSTIKSIFKIIIPAILLAGSQQAHAQSDTLRLSFRDAEKLFLENNLSLLAQKYNVDASKALIKQAALWDNPVLTTDQNITDNSGKFFAHSANTGQLYFQMSQLFTTAGKRGKQVQIAKDGAGIQQAAFDDMLRNLRYNLELDMAQAATLAEQARVYQTEISSATNLVAAIQKSFEVGNNSLKDVVRLKALLFSLQTDMVENNRQLNDLQAELKTLLGIADTRFVLPQIITSAAAAAELNVADLLEKAKINRGDYMANVYTLQQNNDNVKLQKAMAVPDVTVGVAYDQNSSYAPHYVGLQIGLPIPLFNRNQGNIKAAKLNSQGQEYVVKNAELQLQNDIYAAVNQYKLNAELLNSSQTGFYDKYDQLYESMLKGFKLRQVSLPEFVDFFDSYKDTRLKLLDQRYQLAKAVADLNYATGTNVINPL